MDGRRATGQEGEAVAEAYLTAHRFRIVARNFRCRAGEIDLVAFEGATIVFVEVRARRGRHRGTALESIDARKQAQVARVAQYFVAQRGWADRDARFDVVGIQFDTDPPTVDHVRGAFEVAA